MKVSFIIPIYKVEQYIEQCVDSVLSQSYQDMEVILVDDGSPDKCPSICDSFAEKDNRVKVLHKPNGGLSDARNAGLKIASGEYVVFMDGDDFWTNNLQLGQLVNIVKKNPECDFVGFNCSYYFPQFNKYKSWIAYSNNIISPVTGNVALIQLVKSGTFPMSACLKIMKKDFLIENELLFEKGLLAEDIPWFINMLDKCNKCMFINQYIYAYRQNVIGSITNSGGERSFNNLFTILKREIEKIEARSFNIDAKNALFSFLAYEFCILLSMLSGLPNVNEKRKNLYRYKWLLQYTDNPKVKKVNIVYRIFGIEITERVLRIYNNRRKV